ncbi:AsmA family protein [Fodinibius sp. AD559]|uniref:AsmA family protein n=1 Tax=Fodinibius sp. AD559 TaxID=3424179 RepID=UPI004046B343
MFYRWLYKSWKYFWRIVFVLLLTAVVLSGIIIGILQLDVTKNYLADRIEQQVEQTYKAELNIGDVDGFLPFQMSLYDVTLLRSDESEADTLVSVKQVDSEIDVWELLQNKLTIVGFSLQSPEVNLRSDKNGRLVLLEHRSEAKKRQRSDGDPWLSRIEIIAPNVSIESGYVYLETEADRHQIGNLPSSFSLTNINASLFVDWSEMQRYLDIESFFAESDNLQVERISASGQLYNDHRFLEFNSFYLTLGSSRFVFNGEVDGVNLLEPNVTKQLKAARYDLDVRSEKIDLKDISDLVANTPDLEKPLSLDFRTEGSADSLWIDRAELGIGESYVKLNGIIKNVIDRQKLSYELRFEGLNLRNEDLAQLLDSLAIPNNEELQSLAISGQANGSLQNIKGDFSVSSTLGTLEIEGETQLVEPFSYKGTLVGKELDIAPFFAERVDTTALNFDARLEGKRFNLDKAVSDLSVTFTNSRVGRHQFERLALSSNLDNKVWNQEYEYHNNDQLLQGSSSINFNDEDRTLAIRGNGQNVNLANFFTENKVAQTALNFDYSVEVQGFEPNHIQGKANLDVAPSVMNDDTVRAHQLYMDLNSPDASTRKFRLTSSLLDLNISGEVTPADVISQTRFWGSYLKNRFDSEIGMTQPILADSLNGSPQDKNVVVDGSLRTKDLGLLKKYFPQFPALYSESDVTFNVNTDGRRLLLSAEMVSDTLSYNNFNFQNTNTQFTASFRSDRTFSEFSSVDWEANISKMETESVDLDSTVFDLSVKQDSIYFTQHVGAISDDAQFDMTLQSNITDSVITVSVEDFFVGNNQYAWINERNPKLQYFRSGEIDFDDFSFQNKNEYFRLQGTLSSNRSDSLTYTLHDINLKRISNLIKGKVDFAGVLNGSLVTKSFTHQPTIQGDLNINRFRMNNRIVGDVRFNSKYNPDKQRFDTRIDILTDSTKYEDYLASNDGIGQDIRLDGYVVTPDPTARQDTVYHFNADFDQIDLWFLAVIADNVFAEVEGQASGTGHITGNLEDYDFQSQFEIENVFARPEFMNTNYFLSGPVQFNKDEGVVLDSLNVMDTKGGTGTIWGTVDLNDFDPITYLDLALNMNRLQFLNNKMDPDVPFYGNVSGTGLVRLSGSNTDMYMRTEGPVEITSDSEVSIPLLEETELQESGKFIRFVDSFDEVYKKAESPVKRTVRESERAEEALEQALEEMTFTERFDLDLRFNASENLSVNLIFDPVTGEVLTAQGTGQLRITMQDQDVQMFGQYNINGGNYQFVTGEIISRRLQLEPGGTIVWEGPPDNARLDISAVYNARPNVSTLLNEDDLNGQNGGQQVPVDLIVEINGTLNSVENNYYFRLPSTMELSSNSTLQYTLNQINRDEQQKLLQATSILFTGQFIPTQGVGTGTAMLSQNLTRGSTYVNPFLSNQVSSLLSNQINTLLNSDVSRLDIDFNLNAYNEVDLGIALRLYNDRLIFRREGQITGGGPQSTPGDRIGDLNATYRIRKGLSLTAFHRQDQALSNVQASSQVGDVTPYVDGLGIESQVQFNTWNKLINRIKGIFGMNEDSANNE